MSQQRSHMAPSCMHHLPHFCDKQDCVQMINIEKSEEFESIVGELAGNLTPKFSDFVRSVISNNGIKTPKNPSGTLDIYFFWKR